MAGAEVEVKMKGMSDSRGEISKNDYSKFCMHCVDGQLGVQNLATEVEKG